MIIVSGTSCLGPCPDNSIAVGVEGKYYDGKAATFSDYDQLFIRCYPVECGWIVTSNECVDVAFNETVVTILTDAGTYPNWVLCPEEGYYGIVSITSVDDIVTGIRCCLVIMQGNTA